MDVIVGGIDSRFPFVMLFAGDFALSSKMKTRKDWVDVGKVAEDIGRQWPENQQRQSNLPDDCGEPTRQQIGQAKCLRDKGIQIPGFNS